MKYAAFLIAGVSFADHQIPLLPTRGIGVAGQEGEHIVTLLNENFIHIIRGYDFGFRDPVGQLFPEVGNGTDNFSSEIKSSTQYFC